MQRRIWLSLCVAFTFAAPLASANNYSDAIANFKAAGESSNFFHTCYAYAIFPNVGEGGFVVGGQLPNLGRICAIHELGRVWPWIVDFMPILIP